MLERSVQLFTVQSLNFLDSLNEQMQGEHQESAMEDDQNPEAEREIIELTGHDVSSGCAFTTDQKY